MSNEKACHYKKSTKYKERWQERERGPERLQERIRTSHQDGGVGKHAVPPCTTAEKITTRPQNK